MLTRLLSFLPDNKEIEPEECETILQVAMREDIPHFHVCGGNGKCSTCRVLILEGLENCSEQTPEECEMAEKLQLGECIRLACQTRVSGPVKLRRLVLDPDDVELVVRNKDTNIRGPVGQEKEVAIMFVDIKGFTSFAERFPPYDVVHVLDRFFYQMDDVVQKYGGTIDNTMGDGFMALFGVAEGQGCVLSAVAAGFGVLEKSKKMRRYTNDLYKWDLDVRLGIHSGTVIVGSIGTTDTRKVTAIGDAVNVASRIETANKELGTQFLISEEVYERVKDRIEVSKTYEIKLAGKSDAHLVYEPTEIKPCG